MGFLVPSIPIVLLLLIAPPSSAATQPVPPFTITAANVTLASTTSRGSSAYTVSGMPLTGTLVVSCSYSGPATTAKIPVCGTGPIAQIPVTAGQTITGTMPILPYGTPIPLSSARSVRGLSSLAFVLGGVFLLGLGSWSRSRHWLCVLLLATGAMAIVLMVGACGGSNSFAGTPGTYRYTLTAGNSGENISLSANAVTTITVTVQ